MIETLSLDSQAVSAIDIQSIATDTTTTGTGFAWGRFRSLMVVIWAGTITDGSFVFEVQDSDNNSNFTAVADAYLDGTEPTLTGSSDNGITVIGYKGSRKYVRIVITSTGTTSGGVMGALFVASNSYRTPVAR